MSACGEDRGGKCSRAASCGGEMGVHSAKGGGRKIQNYGEQHKNRQGSEALGCREQSKDVKSTRRALVSFSFFSFCALTPAPHAHTHTHAAKRTPHSLQLQQCAVALQRICNCCCSFIANAIALKAVQTTTRRARKGPQGWWATVSSVLISLYSFFASAHSNAHHKQNHTQPCSTARTTGSAVRCCSSAPLQSPLLLLCQCCC